jgi:hypothetical protein
MDGFTAFLKQDLSPAEAPPAETLFREPRQTASAKRIE